MTLGKILTYVLIHPCRKQCYPEATDTKIAETLSEACLKNELYLTVDINNNITGLIHAIINDNEIFICTIITSHPKALITFLGKWQELYPFHTVVGNRNGKLKRYNLNNFLKRLNEF